MKTFISYILISLFLSCNTGTPKVNKGNKIKGDTSIFRIPEKPTGWVSDFEGIFSPGEIQYLDSIIAEHEKETSNEIVVVTYKSDSGQIRTSGEFDAFALLLFNQWGIGKKEKNNGLCILISNNLRKVRIEVGYGLESRLTDMEAKAIIDSVFIPAFKDSQFFRGVSKGLEVIFKEIK